MSTHAGTHVSFHKLFTYSIETEISETVLIHVGTYWLKVNILIHLFKMVWFHPLTCSTIILTYQIPWSIKDNANNMATHTKHIICYQGQGTDFPFGFHRYSMKFEWSYRLSSILDNTSLILQWVGSKLTSTPLLFQRFSKLLTGTQLSFAHF